MKTLSYLLLIATTTTSIFVCADWPLPAQAQQPSQVQQPANVQQTVVVQQPGFQSPLQQGPLQNQYQAQAPDLGFQGTWASDCVPANSFLPTNGPVFGAQQLSMTFNGTYVNWAIEQFRDTDCHIPMSALVVKEGSWTVVAVDQVNGSTDIGVLYTQCSGIACGRPNDPREFFSAPYLTLRAYVDNRGPRLKVGHRDLGFNTIFDFGSLTKISQ